MLCLGRKVDQKIRIGEGIFVTVVRVNRLSGKVVLGIDAPDHVEIMRTELDGEADDCEQEDNDDTDTELEGVEDAAGDEASREGAA